MAVFDETRWCAAVLTDPLPTKTELLQACRGVDHDWHPILRAAHELSCLHERQSSVDHIDRRRTDLIREIDRWVRTNLPPTRGGAYLHTETLGAIIDRLARYTATAYAALTSTSDFDLGNAWEALAELAVGYEDLADEISSGRRRLPGGP